MTLNYYFPRFVFKKNVIIMDARYVSQYPTDNFYPASLGAVGFADRTGYRLGDSSRYRKAGTDRKDVGVDFDSLSAAMGPLFRSRLGAHGRALDPRER